MKRILVVVMLAALVACGGKEHPGIIAARNAVEASLKDPASAQFRNVRVVKLSTKAGQTEAVCGEVNAKNGFGGYTGFEPFAYSMAGQLLMPSKFPAEGAQVAAEGIATICSGNLP